MRLRVFSSFFLADPPKLSVLLTMRERKSIRYISLFTIALFLICAGDALCAGDSSFHISKGVNISHWLSQSQRRGQERQAYFTKKDVAYIAGLGYDHIRLPIDEEQMWDESGNKENEAFTLLNNAIKWSDSQHLKVVVDLHILRSHHFNAEDKPLWTGVGKYKGPVNYPGQIVAPRDIEGLPADIAGSVKRNNGVYNREILEKLLEKPLAMAKKYDLPLYCGEWGCLSTVPRKARLQWYSDIRHNLEKHNIAWANWDYKGGFGIIGRASRPDEEMIRALIPK